MKKILLELSHNMVELLRRYGYHDAADLNGKLITKKQYKEVQKDISNARREDEADNSYYHR